MVKVSSLSFSYGNGKLISDLSFMLDTGRIMAILGPNGRSEERRVGTEC